MIDFNYSENKELFVQMEKFVMNKTEGSLSLLQDELSPTEIFRQKGLVVNGG